MRAIGNFVLPRPLSLMDVWCVCVGRGWVTRGSRAERFREDLEKARGWKIGAKKGGKGKGKNKKEERRRADWLRNEERRVESRLCTVERGEGGTS